MSMMGIIALGRCADEQSSRAQQHRRRAAMIKIWQFRFSGETETREIPYGEFEAFLETLPLPSRWPFSKDLEDIRDLKLKKIGVP